MYNILLVEDNPKIQTLNKNLFEATGCLAENLAEARQHIDESAPDIIVLDIMLPDGNGLDFLVELRDGKVEIPVLLLTALGATHDRVKGLRLGGDDYLAKPYDNSELLARIETILRRSHKAVLNFGTLSINRDIQRAYINGSDVVLSRIEYALHLMLALNEDKILSAEYLYQGAWGVPLNSDTRSLRVQISTLRKKIEPAGYSIVGKRKKGYASRNHKTKGRFV